jgi:catechol 2,3-dioxygenase-like lactoylglutathione lyase family enzyme
MPITSGAHHLATLTNDLDRLIDFYTRVFDAEVTELMEDDLRHAFINLGGGFVLHPFERPAGDVPQGEVPIFSRGRIDHLALRADSLEDFWELRERIHAAGGSDGLVTDLGPLLSAGFTDPDGLWGEVCWDRPAGQERATPEPANWVYIRYPDRL